MIIGFDASRAFNKNRTGTENYSFQILSNLLKLDQTNNYKIYVRPGIGTDWKLDVRNWKIDKEIRNLKLDNPTSNIQPHHPASNLQPPTSNYNFIPIPFPYLWTQAGLALQTFKDKDLDVLFVPSHTLPIIRRPGLKTVITVHDLGAEYLPKTHQLKQRLYLKLMTDYQLNSATHIIAVSNATKKDLMEKIGIPEEKITVIYEGFNEELFSSYANGAQTTDYSRQIAVDSKPLAVSNPYFLFVGTIQPRKNLERLIRAYYEFLRRGRSCTCPLSGNHKGCPYNIPNLVLAGGKGWLSDEIYALPKKLGIEDEVKFLGFVPDKDLPALYQGAYAFVFPSLFEGFGLPVLEAFASGCPVLTSNTSSLPEVAGKAALLVNPYSVEEITKGLISLTTDLRFRDLSDSRNYRLRTKLIKLGYEQVKKFSWQKAARETLRVLEKVLSSPT